MLGNIIKKNINILPFFVGRSTNCSIFSQKVRIGLILMDFLSGHLRIGASGFFVTDICSVVTKLSAIFIFLADLG